MTEQAHGRADRIDHGDDILSVRLHRVLITVTARLAPAPIDCVHRAALDQERHNESPARVINERAMHKHERRSSSVNPNRDPSTVPRRNQAR
jgi:hypothetical protein